MSRDSHRIAAFSLIELLVVISIVSLLVAILLPSLSKAREQAAIIRGASNLRQAGIALTMYRGDFKDTLPRVTGDAFTGWIVRLDPYVSTLMTRTPTACPDFYLKTQPTSTAYGSLTGNIHLIGGASAHWQRFDRIRRTNTTFVISHGIQIASWSPTHFDTVFANTTWNPPLKGRGLNFYFADDHVGWMDYKGASQSEWWATKPATTGWTYSGYKYYGP